MKKKFRKFEYKGRNDGVPEKDDLNVQTVSGHFPTKDISCVNALVDSDLYSSKSDVMVEVLRKYIKEEKNILRNFEVEKISR